MAVITRLSWFWQQHADTRSVTSPVTCVRPLVKISLMQSELNSLTQLSVPLQGRHRTYEDLQLATALHPAHSSTQPPALSSDDHSTHLTVTDPVLLMQHSRTREQSDSHYRITASIPYTVHLLSPVPAGFMHHYPSLLSLAGSTVAEHVIHNMTHHTLTSCIS